MKTRLNLSIERDLVEEVKHLAKSMGISVSQWMENKIRESRVEVSGEEVPELYQRLVDSLQLPSVPSAAEAKADYLKEKYG